MEARDHDWLGLSSSAYIETYTWDGGEFCERMNNNARISMSGRALSDEFGVIYLEGSLLYPRSTARLRKL